MEAEQKTRLALLADGAIYVTEAYRAAAAHARYARRDADLLVALDRGDAGGAMAKTGGVSMYIYSVFRQHAGHQREQQESIHAIRSDTRTASEIQGYIDPFTATKAGTAASGSGRRRNRAIAWQPTRPQ